MIQPTTKNKYRFNMQVSVRAIGSRDRSSPQPTTARRDRFSRYSTNRVGGKNRRLKRMAAQHFRCFRSASQIRDCLTAWLRPTEGTTFITNRLGEAGC